MLGALITRQIVKSAMKNSVSSQALEAGAGEAAALEAPRPRVKPGIIKRAGKLIAGTSLAVVTALAVVQAVTTMADMGYSYKATQMTHLDASAPVSQADLRALGDEYAQLFRMGGRQFVAGMAASSPFSDLDDLREDRNGQNGSFFDAGAAFQRKNNLFKEEIRAVSDRFEQANDEFREFYASNMQDGNVALLAGAVTALRGHSEALDDRIVAAIETWKSGSETRSVYAEQLGKFMRTEMALNPVLLAQTAALLDEYRPVLDAQEKRGLGRHIEDMPEAQRERAIELMGSPYITFDEMPALVPGREALTRILESDAPEI